MAIREFLRDRRGNYAMLMGLAMLPIMGGVAIAVDTANMNRARDNAQAALDTASMEIATHLNSGLDDDELEALGDRLFKANLGAGYFEDDATLPSLSYLGVLTEADGSQSLSTKVDFTYTYLIPRTLPDPDRPSSTVMHVRAQISARSGDTACVYALNHTAPRAVEAGGNTNIVMDGCVIASNSNASDSVYVGGSASLAADCIQSSGGIESSGGLTTDCGQNRENAWRLADPFESLIEPVPPILFANPKKADTTMHPGRYSNLTLDGTKELEPGLYYIEGSLSIKGTVTGTGVTIFMKDGGITINGNASLSLDAPQSGDYAGLLFWSSRTNTSSHTFNGNGDTDLNGFLYFPKGAVNYIGNNTTTSTCLRIVADTIEMSGSSNLKSDCSEELGGREAKVAGPLYFSR